MCVIWGIAAVAEEENFFLVGFAADWARTSFFLFFELVVNPSIGIEICDLFLVFDSIFGQDGAWREVSNFTCYGPCKNDFSAPTLELWPMKFRAKA